MKLEIRNVICSSDRLKNRRMRPSILRHIDQTLASISGGLPIAAIATGQPSLAGLSDLSA
jgi:hypothetical protein